jgi:PAS domain-containing protein
MDASAPPWVVGIDADDRNVVKACLRAAVDGPFFPDWEFPTLFGLEREEVRQILASWPEGADADTQFIAVNNALGQLLGYPHGREDAWDDFIPVSREQLQDLVWRVREHGGANDQSREYIAAQLQKFASLPDSELLRATALVRELISAARRYGVEVPTELQGRLAADTEQRNEAS